MSEVSTGVRRFMGSAMTAAGGVMLAVSLLSPSSTANASDFVEPDYSFANDVDESNSGEWTDADKTAYYDRYLETQEKYDLPQTYDGMTIRTEVYKMDGASSCGIENLVWKSEPKSAVGSPEFTTDFPLGEGEYRWVTVLEDAQGNEVSRTGCDDQDDYSWEWSIDASSMSEDSVSDDPPRSVYSISGLALLGVGLPMTVIPARRRKNDADDDLSDLALTSTYTPAGISDEQEELWTSILDNIDECVRADIAEDDADLRSITEYLARIRREWEDLPSSATEDHESAESRAVTGSLRALAARSEEVVQRVYAERTRAVALTREVIAARYGDENFEDTARE